MDRDDLEMVIDDALRMAIKRCQADLAERDAKKALDSAQNECARLKAVQEKAAERLVEVTEEYDSAVYSHLDVTEEYNSAVCSLADVLLSIAKPDTASAAPESDAESPESHPAFQEP